MRPALFLNLRGRQAVAWLALLAGASSFAAPPTPWLPPPGEYRVDSTSTHRTRTPLGVMERIEQIDGATGRSTVTQKVPGSQAPVVNTYPGKGPVHVCQVAAAAPPAGCSGALTADGDAARAAVACAGQQQDYTFRRLADGVWEKRLKVIPAGAPQAMPVKTVEAMAPVIAEMEARMKVAPPDEAAMLRQQLVALKGGNAPAVDGPEVENVQRWTWVSSRCTSAR